MLISTMNDIPGYEITEVLGEVFGLTVRSRNIGSQLGSAFKSMAGGELKGMTKNLIDSRNEVVDRMTQEAQARGGDAVVAFRPRPFCGGRCLTRGRPSRSRCGSTGFRSARRSR